MAEAAPQGSAGALGRVVGQASWATIDQALFSASGFAVNLILALWVTPEEYGGYMAASAVFWIALSFHDGLVIQPMMVFGSGRFHDRPNSYLAMLVTFHWCVSAIISAAFAIGGLTLIACGARTAGSGVLGFAAAAPSILLLWLVRRRFYVWSHPRLAAGACALYVVGVLVIVLALHDSGMLSSFTAALAAGGASALAVAAAVATRGFRLRLSRRGDPLREVAIVHWRYGRWAVLTGVAGWARGGVYYIVVPALAGLEANASLNVLWNLTMPAVLLNFAATALLVPAFIRARQHRRARSLMWVVLLVLMAGMALYALLVALFGEMLIDLVYRGRYSQYAHLAWLMGLILLPTAAITTFSAFLRAHERPDRELSANLCATAVACLGIIGIEAWGLVGAITGLLASGVTSMLVLLWWVKRIDLQHRSMTNVAQSMVSTVSGTLHAPPARISQ
jgi:O-antigen/teichoic acid export membrane protein